MTSFKLIMYVKSINEKNTFEVISLKGNKEKNIDSNFFKEMNYEIAGEHGVLDNEDMKNNKNLEERNKKRKVKSNKK